MELIDKSDVHRKIAIFFDHSMLGLEKKFFQNKEVKASQPPTPPLFYKVNS